MPVEILAQIKLDIARHIDQRSSLKKQEDSADNLHSDDEEDGSDDLVVADARAEVVYGDAYLMRDKDSEANRNEDKQRSGREPPPVLPKVGI